MTQVVWKKIVFRFFRSALRYRQDSYRHIIETVPSTTQPSRANQQYPPPNLWTPNDYTSQQQQQQQIFMSGIQRPFPGVASAATVQQQQGSAIQAASASTNPLGSLSGSSSAYLPSHSTVPSSTFPADQTHLNHRHFAPLDANLASIDMSAPNPYPPNTNSISNSNANFYGSQRIHPSPSGHIGYPAAFGGYAPNSFNHHHHHHHLSSNDDASFLIQNPSLTWSIFVSRFRFHFDIQQRNTHTRQEISFVLVFFSLLFFFSLSLSLRVCVTWRNDQRGKGERVRVSDRKKNDIHIPSTLEMLVLVDQPSFFCFSRPSLF